MKDNITVSPRFTGRDLRRLREGHGLNKSVMARLLGVSHQTLARWELTEREDLPLMLRMALAAWTRGIPAMGCESAVLPADLPLRKARKSKPNMLGLLRYWKSR